MRNGPNTLPGSNWSRFGAALESYRHQESLATFQSARHFNETAPATGKESWGRMLPVGALRAEPEAHIRLGKSALVPNVSARVSQWRVAP